MSSFLFPHLRKLALLTLALLLLTSLGNAQEAFLVSNFSNGMSVFDLATSNAISQIAAGDNNFAVAIGQNPRLAFLSTSQYLSVIDLTIQREIRRLPLVKYSRGMAFTPDGRYLARGLKNGTVEFFRVAEKRI